jgi:hypothetical protein
MAKVKHRVGPKGKNDPDDVRLVQTRLAVHRDWLTNVPGPTGLFDATTAAAIVEFQTGPAALATADGNVDAGGYTMTALELDSIPKPRHKVFIPVCWAHGPAVDDTDYQNAATTLGCEVAAIKAVSRVETKRQPWDEVGRPTILFERHYFASKSGGKYNVSHPDISNPNQGGYGKYSAQYPKLFRAATLNENAALQSASWGMFQIMGANFGAAGFASVESFVDAMLEGEKRHLAAFVAFVGADATLKSALKDKKWATFALHYNGKGYKKNNYDVEMQNAYDALTKK